MSHLHRGSPLVASAPGQGPHPLPHLRRDCAHPFHICAHARHICVGAGLRLVDAKKQQKVPAMPEAEVIRNHVHTILVDAARAQLKHMKKKELEELKKHPQPSKMLLRVVKALLLMLDHKPQELTSWDKCRQCHEPLSARCRRVPLRRVVAACPYGIAAMRPFGISSALSVLAGSSSRTRRCSS